MDEARLANWLRIYKMSWEALDTPLFLSLFAADAAYYPSPFWIPLRGHQALGTLWGNLKQRQTGNHIDFHVLSIAGSVALVRWTATSIRLPDREPRRGDGVFQLTFDRTGLCAEVVQWQHWHDDREPAPCIEDRLRA